MKVLPRCRLLQLDYDSDTARVVVFGRVPTLYVVPVAVAWTRMKIEWARDIRPEASMEVLSRAKSVVTR